MKLEEMIHNYIINLLQEDDFAAYEIWGNFGKSIDASKDVFLKVINDLHEKNIIRFYDKNENSTFVERQLQENDLELWDDGDLWIGLI